MPLTALQEKAVKIVIDRYKAKEKYTVISGYAGCGKSFCIKYIVSALSGLGIDPDKDVIACAFTGKACQVLSEKGNKNVLTLHKLMYDFKLKADGTFVKRKKTHLDYKIVFVDECSMAPKSLVDELLSYNVYVVFCGDPAQLPPINREEDNHLLDNPHIFLSEIIRQANDSEIIQLSLAIRENKSFNKFQNKEVQILNKHELTTGMLQWADEILVATNKTRININKQMRESLGFENQLPQEDDKVICCRNYWETYADTYDNLINGMIGTLHNKYDIQYNIPSYYGGGKIDITMAEFITELGNKFDFLPMDTQMITTGTKTIDNKLAYRLQKNKSTKFIIPYEFTYGYAITVHKSQGSSWPNILVIEENFPFDSIEHAQWLYTAVTRAEQHIVLLR